MNNNLPYFKDADYIFPVFPPEVKPQPNTVLSCDEKEKLLYLEQRIKQKIVGQDAAISAVCRAVKRNKVGLKDPVRPVGCFIFVGTSGCGKSELCKALAEELYGPDKLIKIDMSELSERWDMTKLIGAAPGYIGYENGGQLTNKIKQNPESVLCLDEIEKADPGIYNLFLQIMEDGVLTSSQGETVSFKDVIIIFTTNTGTDEITNQIGFAGDYDEEKAKKAGVTAALKKTFKPEFLNRIDEVIVFNRLREKHVLEICSLLLKKIKQRANQIDLKISFDKSAIAELARIGYNKEYGARPLRRAISANVEDMLAEKILTGEIKSGDNIRIIYNENGFSAEKLNKQKENSYEL